MLEGDKMEKAIKRSLMIIAVVAIFAGITACECADKHETNKNIDEAAIAIMKQVVSHYQVLKSYQDDGEKLLLDPQSNSETNKFITSVTYKFITLFQRPSQFKFEFKEIGEDGKTEKGADGKENIYVFWADGKNIWSLLPIYSEPMAEKDLIKIGSESTLYSFCSSHNIPRLLTDGFGGRRLDNIIENISITGREQFEGVECYVLTGRIRYIGFHKIKLWIGTTDYLIRKIQEDFLDHSRWEEIHHNIKIDEIIPDSQFSYNAGK